MDADAMTHMGVLNFAADKLSPINCDAQLGSVDKGDSQTA